MPPNNAVLYLPAPPKTDPVKAIKAACMNPIHPCPWIPSILRRQDAFVVMRRKTRDAVNEASRVCMCVCVVRLEAAGVFLPPLSVLLLTGVVSV